LLPPCSDLTFSVRAGSGSAGVLRRLDFVAAGAEILTQEELEYTTGLPTWSHALKEP